MHTHTTHHPEIMPAATPPAQPAPMRKMTELVSGIFEGYKVRTVIDERDEVWFVAADVCKVLGLSNVTMAVSAIDEADRQRVDLLALRKIEGNKSNGLQPWQKDEVNVISEAGLYRLVSRSNRPEARRFQSWVYSEVLPSIRKTGRYSESTPVAIETEARPGRGLLGWEKLQIEQIYNNVVMAAPEGIRTRMRRHLRRDMRVLCEGMIGVRLTGRDLRVRSNDDVQILIQSIKKGALHYPVLLPETTRKVKSLPPVATMVSPSDGVKSILVMGHPLVLPPKWYRPIEIEKMVYRCTGHRYRLPQNVIERVAKLLGMHDEQSTKWRDMVRANQYRATAVAAILEKATQLRYFRSESMNGELVLSVPIQ